MSRRSPSLRRWLFWLCRRDVFKASAAGNAARRLLDADPTPETVDQWVADLNVLLARAWEVSPDTGLYTASMRAQGAAVRLEEVIEVAGVAGFIERLKEEGVA